MNQEREQSGKQINKDQIAMIQRIDSFLTVISFSEKKFLDDLKHKFGLYGDKMYLSIKQVDWLEKIYERVLDAFSDGFEGLPHNKSTKVGPKYVGDDVEF